MSGKSTSTLEYANQSDADGVKISLSQLTNFVSNTEGKVLTIIDASISDPNQLRAIKTLLSTALWNNHDLVKNWYYDQSEDSSSMFPFRGNVSYHQSEPIR